MTTKNRPAQEEVQDFKDQLEELREKLGEVVEMANDLAREADRIGLPYWVSGQLTSYLSGNVEQFIDSEYQPGSIASITQGLENELRSEDEE